MANSASPNDLLQLANSFDGSAASFGVNSPMVVNNTISATGTVATSSATGFLRTSLATGITAFAGGGQGSATALAAGINDVTTCATGGDSTKLPSPTAGMQVVVGNSGAASMNLFPASGHSINAGAANAAVAVASGKVAVCNAISTTKWLVTVGA